MAQRPGGFFQNLKAKVTETIKEFKEDFQGPPDPYEKRISEHIDRATSDLLSGPDWGLNFELVDIINNDPQGTSDKVYRALKCGLLKPSIQTQLLTLTLLEACVKNCVPFFFQQLIYSDLWSELIKAGEPFRNWDPEVRDRALGLIEDFAKGLPLAAYKDAYENLLDRGVDFPVRPQSVEASGVPYYTPPAMPAAAAAAAAQGISPEDRAAIAAAVADLEAEAARHDADDAARAPPGMPAPGHVPAVMGPAVLMGAPIRPPGYHAPPGYHPPPVAATQPAMVAGAAPITAEQHAGAAAGDATGVPTGREEVEQTLRVSRNSSELLLEMLGPIKASGDLTGLQETFVMDLVEQCSRYKSMLAELIPSLTEEDLISSALAANDDLSRALTDYEELAQKASTGGLAPTATAAADRGASSGGAAAAAAWGSSSGGGAAPTSTFTLLDEDDDEGEDLSLATRRGAQAAPQAAQPVKADDLILLDSEDVATSSTPAEQQLTRQLDDLLLSAQPPKQQQ